MKRLTTASLRGTNHQTSRKRPPYGSADHKMLWSLQFTYTREKSHPTVTISTSTVTISTSTVTISTPTVTIST